MIEQWLPCPGFKAYYEVSNLGRIKRSNANCGTRKGKLVKPWGPRAMVSLCVEQVITKKSISRLVCEAFKGPPPSDKHQAAHWDGDALNNNAKNLRWATQAENEQDKKRHGRWNHSAKGSKHKDAKLTESDIPKIKAAFVRGISGPKLAKKYGVDFKTIYNVVNGKSWTHV